jgi:hypothetical protein
LKKIWILLEFLFKEQLNDKRSKGGSRYGGGERERERAERGEGVPGVEISLRSSSEPNDRPMSSRVERSVREG